MFGRKKSSSRKKTAHKRRVSMETRIKRSNSNHFKRIRFFTGNRRQELMSDYHDYVIFWQNENKRLMPKSMRESVKKDFLSGKIDY